ncbi:MAG TPA: DUF3822 family protein [Bacteroidia bacterium]|nr:DUF3822 family protein [Bacteroidia bacterium]
MAETRRYIIPAVAFRDAAFDTARTEKFCLVMQVGGDSLTLAVLDNLTNDFLAFEHYVFRKTTGERSLAEQIDKLVSEHEWLGNGFKRVDACIVTEKFTLVPAAFFDSTKISDYLKFNQPVADEDIVINDVLRNAEARNVYAFDSNLEKSLKKISSSIRIRHHLSALIEKTLSINKNKTSRRALAHVQNQRFDLIISEGGKLLLANSFNFQTSEDFIYYLLFTCEQLKMNPEEMELEIVGEIETNSALAELAKKYIRNVRFGQRPVEARFAKEFEKFPSHFYHNLFSLHYFS